MRIISRSSRSSMRRAPTSPSRRSIPRSRESWSRARRLPSCGSPRSSILRRPACLSASWSLQSCPRLPSTRCRRFVLRLPWAVAPLFEQWLEEQFPDRRDKVLNRIRDLREGKLYDSSWSIRQRGKGTFAEQIRAIFEVTCRRLGLNQRDDELSTAAFRRRTAQATLF